MRLPVFRCSFAAVLTAGLLPAQIAGQIPSTPQMRYVDFSRDLDRPGVAVVVGTLGKFKEGKRERLADGSLGSNTAKVSVSGTQYFKVPVQATITPRATFAGDADKPSIAFDVQLARLPDGKEQRQSMTGNGASIEEGTLALFVIASKPKGKRLELLAVIPFDATVDKGPDAEPEFVDTMHDFWAVNQRVHDLQQQLDAADKATDAAAKDKALAALRELTKHDLELRKSQNDPLVSQYVAPLLARARKRIDEPAAPAGGEAPGSGK
ncbi:MAG TPA: hypothetical protein VFZ65_15665 [Planctomycetota bacterium]|nr:hypothetical protein [Planctomycetota bacterium]